MTAPVDVHTHILPGMDDGSRSVEESLAMLREETRQGLSTVVLTPHFYARQNAPEEFLQRRQQSWDRLYPALEEGMPRLLLGAEVQYFEGISQVSDINTLCIEDTGYFLLEMPFQKWTEREIQEALILKRHRGLQVILAHVDRYFAWQGEKVWERMAESGVLMQLNADAFLHFRSRRKALRLLKKGLVQFVASDCHNLTSRAPNLEKIDDYIQKYENQLLTI